MRDRIVVITGASAGIGAALAEEVSRRGGKVVLSARREGALREAAARCAGATLAIAADATRRADLTRLLDEAIARFGAVDVWVNNAGRGITRAVSEITDEDFDEMMTVNVKSALHGMQVALAHFKGRGRGHIVNVSSLLGRLPYVATRSAYSAAKHALNSLTANLRMELRTDFPDIHVSLVSPGVVATEFGVHALHGGMDSRRIPGAQPAAEVAAVIADVIERPRADVYTRPEYQRQIAAYYSAEDLGAFEAQLGPPRKP